LGATATSCQAGTALCFTESLAYDYSVGKPTRYTDINGNPTTYGYNDALDRLRTVARPDGGSTAFTYDDTAGSVNAASSVAQTSGTPSVVTSKPAIEGHFKTGQRTAFQDKLVIPCQPVFRQSFFR
jgi:YD repeat-containing protein